MRKQIIAALALVLSFSAKADTVSISGGKAKKVVSAIISSGIEFDLFGGDRLGVRMESFVCSSNGNTALDLQYPQFGITSYSCTAFPYSIDSSSANLLYKSLEPIVGADAAMGKTQLNVEALSCFIERSQSKAKQRFSCDIVTRY